MPDDLKTMREGTAKRALQHETYGEGLPSLETRVKAIAREFGQGTASPEKLAGVDPEVASWIMRNEGEFQDYISEEIKTRGGGRFPSADAARWVSEDLRGPVQFEGGEYNPRRLADHPESGSVSLGDQPPKGSYLNTKEGHRVLVQLSPNERDQLIESLRPEWTDEEGRPKHPYRIQQGEHRRLRVLAEGRVDAGRLPTGSEALVLPETEFDMSDPKGSWDEMDTRHASREAFEEAAQKGVRPVAKKAGQAAARAAAKKLLGGLVPIIGAGMELADIPEAKAGTITEEFRTREEVLKAEAAAEESAAFLAEQPGYEPEGTPPAWADPEWERQRRFGEEPEEEADYSPEGTRKSRDAAAKKAMEK